MFVNPSVHGRLLVTVCFAGALLAADSAPGGGDVLSATAKAKGYSLTELASVTAFFNTDWRHRSPENEPDLPFQIIDRPVGGDLNFIVDPGTMLYVPILSMNDSPPVYGDFPADPTDRDAVLEYFYSPEQNGFQYVEIVVDGTTTSLGADYVVGIRTEGLPRRGTGYITVGAVLTPFTSGVHTVTIRALADGEANGPHGWQFEITYTVTVL